MIYVYVFVPILLLAAAIGAFFWRRSRRPPQTRLISFVALLREPTNIDPTVLARIAGEAWKADLGDGYSEGADGFVVGADILSTIMCKGKMYLANCFPSPYMEDVEGAAAAVPDLRIRSLLLEHQAWLSLDAMGVEASAEEDEIVRVYRRLAKVFAELLDDNCLLIYLPDLDRAYPFNQDTEAALRSKDPLQALAETSTVPVIEVGNDDPLMKKAVAKARAEWPKFLEA